MNQTSERNKEIQKILTVVFKHCDNEMPSGIYTELGEIYGITRERVRQIGQKIDLPKITPKKYRRVCTICFNSFTSPHPVIQRFCSDQCRAESARQRIKAGTVIFNCKNCDLNVSYYKAKNSPPRVFCTKECQGQYLGRMSGFNVQHRNNKGFRLKPLLSQIRTVISDVPYSEIKGKKVIERDRLIIHILTEIKRLNYMDSPAYVRSQEKNR